MLTLAGIAVPSIALVLAVRRWIADVPWRITALFLLLTLGFLHGAVFTSRLPVPVDEAARGYPWRGLFGDVTPRNALTNDAVKLFLPWMQVVREELAQGRAPLWNRYSFSGYPLLANGESAPFSPLFLATLFVPLPKQIVAMAGLKIFVSLLFTYLFCRREDLCNAASVFAAIVFAFSTFETVFLYYSTVSVTAFLPAAVYSLFHAIDRPRKSSVVFVALVIATLMANGHPESVLHIAIAVLVLVAIELALTRDRRDWMRRLGPPLIGVVGGLAISAPAWGPVAEQVRLSARYAALQSGTSFPPIPFTAAWALISPNGFGHPALHNWSWILNYSIVAGSHVALVALVMAIAALFAPRTTSRERARVAVAVLLFLVAMNWTVIGRVANAIPPLSITANDKLRFAVVFIIGVVAAAAIDSSRLLAVAVGIPVVLLAAYVYRVHSAVMRPIDLVGPLTVLAFLAAPREWRALAAGGLAAVELFILNAGFNALVDAKYFRPELPIVDVLRRHAPREPFRIVGRDWVFLPNASAQYGLEDVRGSDPMALASYSAYLDPLSVQEAGTDVKRIVDPDRPELDALNVRFLLAEPEGVLGGKWRLLYRGHDGTLWENSRAMGRFWSPSAKVIGLEQTEAGEFVMRVRAAAAARVDSSQPASPGYHVYVNGRRVRPRTVHDAFLAFDVPSGETVVRVVYRPLSFYGSLVISIIGALLIGSLRGSETGIAVSWTPFSTVPAPKGRLKAWR